MKCQEERLAKFVLWRKNLDKGERKKGFLLWVTIEVGLGPEKLCRKENFDYKMNFSRTQIILPTNPPSFHCGLIPLFMSEVFYGLIRRLNGNSFMLEGVS